MVLEGVAVREASDQGDRPASVRQASDQHSSLAGTHDRVAVREASDQHSWRARRETPDQTCDRQSWRERREASDQHAWRAQRETSDQPSWRERSEEEDAPASGVVQENFVPEGVVLAGSPGGTREARAMLVRP